LIESFYKTVKPIDSAGPSQGATLARNGEVAVSTPQLTGHDVLIYWSLNGKAIPQGRNSHTLDLSAVPNLPGGGTARTQLNCTVIDQTGAVRDEAYRGSGISQSHHSWWIRGEPRVRLSLPRGPVPGRGGRRASRRGGRPRSRARP
jgi:hypothetical protein